MSQKLNIWYLKIDVWLKNSGIFQLYLRRGINNILIDQWQQKSVKTDHLRHIGPDEKSRFETDELLKIFLLMLSIYIACIHIGSTSLTKRFP